MSSVNHKGEVGMAGLFCSEAEFQADVAAMQEAYAARCKANADRFDPHRKSVFVTAAASDSRADWAWDPNGQRKVNALAASGR